MQQLFQANNIRPLSNEEGESHNFTFYLYVQNHRSHQIF